MNTFTQDTLEWYTKYGRDLPWRHTTDPYQILVSEFMLQQTQVSRVIPKFELFLERFPTVTDLASAQLQEVLTIWVGLGYNRRAKFLHQCAQIISESSMPQSKEEFIALPGIGDYMAGAVCAFAYNHPEIVIDANIKNVYNRVFGLTEKEIPVKVKETVPKNNARDFYNALMDIGQFYTKGADIETYPYKSYCLWFTGKRYPELKKVKQKSFQNSNRYYRGQIIKQLVAHKSLDISSLSNEYKIPISQLLDEQLIVQENNMLYLK